MSVFATLRVVLQSMEQIIMLKLFYFKEEKYQLFGKIVTMKNNRYLVHMLMDFLYLDTSLKGQSEKIFDRKRSVRHGQ